MLPNSLPSERAAIVATIDPDAYANSTYTSDWVDMSMFDTIMAIIMVGDLGAETDLDAKLEQATSSGGAGAKDVTGKAITALTHSPVQSDCQSIINCRAEELDVNNGFRYVRLSITNDVTSDFGAVILGFDPRQLPASNNDLASVVEIVA